MELGLAQLGLELGDLGRVCFLVQLIHLGFLKPTSENLDDLFLLQEYLGSRLVVILQNPIFLFKTGLDLLEVLDLGPLGWVTSSHLNLGSPVGRPPC